MMFTSETLVTCFLYTPPKLGEFYTCRLHHTPRVSDPQPSPRNVSSLVPKLLTWTKPQDNRA